MSLKGFSLANKVKLILILYHKGELKMYRFMLKSLCACACVFKFVSGAMLQNHQKDKR